jgi:hypothetical protein
MILKANNSRSTGPDKMDRHQLSKLEQLSRDATKCRFCFEHYGLAAPVTDIAQPRWIGPKYWESAKRVAIVMVNPGSGENSKKKELNRQGLPMLYDFRDGSVSLSDLFKKQKIAMSQWGSSSGKFKDFYIDQLGLDLDEIALANIAWCADLKNEHPRSMLQECFSRHTSDLLKLLDPHIILLAGRVTQSFSKPIAENLPEATIVNMLHHAHREGNDASEAEWARVRKLIE